MPNTVDRQVLLTQVAYDDELQSGGDLKEKDGELPSDGS